MSFIPIGKIGNDGGRATLFMKTIQIFTLAHEKGFVMKLRRKMEHCESAAELRQPQLFLRVLVRANTGSG